jgi:hypothetical protein
MHGSPPAPIILTIARSSVAQKLTPKPTDHPRTFCPKRNLPIRRTRETIVCHFQVSSSRPAPMEFRLLNPSMSPSGPK